MKVLLRRTKTVRVEDAFLKNYPGRLVVWWYGPLTRNAKAGSVPLIVVFFRRMDGNNILNEWVRREIALTHLGLLRIGSVWHLGMQEACIERPTETIEVSFSHDGWTVNSPADAFEHLHASPIPKDQYPLRFSADRNYLLDFRLSGGRNALVPCMEFFARLYGRSAEVKRVLATYAWREAERRLFKPLDEPAAPGTWPLKLTKRMRNDDVVFLAHVRYDDYAQRAAKGIYGQIEATFSANDPYAFLKVTPWFQGPAQLKVAGVRCNNGRTLLALQVLGASQPQGVVIERDRENPGGHADPENSLTSESDDNGYPVRNLSKLPDIVDLTADEEPDPGSSPVDIEDNDFEVLGDPRAVRDRKHATDRGPVGHGHSDEGVSSVSTGEPHGAGKGVGYASVHAPVVLESQGMLRDMWNAARHLQACNSDTVHSVNWFTFEDGFAAGTDPRLVSLTPDEKHSVQARSTWIYQDVKQRIPRGILVIAIEASTATVYLLEIQRRRLAKAGADDAAEESFRGLAIAVRDDGTPHQWLHPLLARIRDVKGIMQKLTGECPGVAYAFKHVLVAGEGRPCCEAAVINALNKVGITIGSSGQGHTFRDEANTDTVRGLAPTDRRSGSGDPAFSPEVRPEPTSAKSGGTDDRGVVPTHYVRRK